MMSNKRAIDHEENKERRVRKKKISKGSHHDEEHDTAEGLIRHMHQLTIEKVHAFSSPFLLSMM